MGDAAPDTVDAYRDYLGRFEKDVGAVEFGTYVKHNGRLIKKLTYDEFDVKWKEVCEANATYDQIVLNGDTINDVLVKVMRERSDELLLERKI